MLSTNINNRIFLSCFLLIICLWKVELAGLSHKTEEERGISSLSFTWAMVTSNLRTFL